MFGWCWVSDWFLFVFSGDFIHCFVVILIMAGCSDGLLDWWVCLVDYLLGFVR